VAAQAHPAGDTHDEMPDPTLDPSFDRTPDPGDLEVPRFGDPQAFLDETGSFLADHEAENNLLFGIAATLTVDPERYRDRPYLAAVRRAREVVAAAVMTPPWNMALSTTEDPAALAALVGDLGRGRVAVPGITAPVDVARRFAAMWTAGRGVRARQTMAERIYRAERITPPTDVIGTVRLGTLADHDLLTGWMRAFLDEVRSAGASADASELVRGDLETGSRTYFIWEDEGRPVSFAGVTGPTPNGIRVGPVYTPPDARRRGYGSAVTAAASQAQLDAGRRFVFLFTDLANPTSNKIYQALGYESVIDVDMVAFEPMPAEVGAP
jgi:predicted GNAT family acetyltransferase